MWSKHVVTLSSSGVWSYSVWPRFGGARMKSVGIREAKAHFAELVRAAANGERIVLTHHGEPLAVITSIEEGSASHAGGSSDALKFKEALLAIPHNVNVTSF